MTEPVDALHVLIQALFMIHFGDIPILYIHPFLYQITAEAFTYEQKLKVNDKYKIWA